MFADFDWYSFRKKLLFFSSAGLEEDPHNQTIDDVREIVLASSRLIVILEKGHNRLVRCR